MTRVERTVLIPSGHSCPVGAYSPGIAISVAQIDTLAFVSGQVATDAAGNVLCRDDPAGQTHTVFDRLAAVLAEAGGGLENLIAVTIYVTDLSHFAPISAVRDERLGTVAPSSALVQVAGLVEAGCLVEISGIAAL